MAGGRVRRACRDEAGATLSTAAVVRSLCPKTEPSHKQVYVHLARSTANTFRAHLATGDLGHLEAEYLLFPWLV